MAKKIVIIGAGIGGLSAGCYARMNGYEAEIYEMHDKAGGLCTAWKRNGYTFDGCLHWLTGSAPGSPFYKFWEELGAVQGRKMFNHEIFYITRDMDGREFRLYTDVDKLEKHMKELSPADAALSAEFCRLIRVMTGLKMNMDKAPELYNLFDKMKMMLGMGRHMKDFIKCVSTSIRDFASGFKDPLIRQGLGNSISPDSVLFIIIMTMSGLNARACGFPQGGSLEFAQAIEKRFLGLGGRIFYKCKVEKIMVKDGNASGIKLADGRDVQADIVISNADLDATLSRLLDGKYPSPFHQELLDTASCYPTAVQVSLGVNRDFSGEPDAVAEHFRLPDAVTLCGKTTEWFNVKNFCFDKSLAPAGKSVLEVLFQCDYGFWDELRNDRARYNAEKKKVLDATLDILEKKYPGLKSCVEVSDVATPVTYNRYCGVREGRFMTWEYTPKLAMKLNSIPRVIPGLSDFYMAGMWVQGSGGVPAGAKSARDIMQIICRRDRKKFITTKA